MGFYPKHLKRRREQENLRTVARAALAGLRVKRETLWGRGWVGRGWAVYWPDGRVGHFKGRIHPARLFLNSERYMNMVGEDGEH